MAFVRKKVVKGIIYLYYVENQRVNGRIKQVILQYLGRADKIKGVTIR